MELPAIRAAAEALTIGIGMSGITASAAQAERARNSTTVVSRAADPYAEHIADASRRFSIPAAWIRAVMRVEAPTIRARCRRRAPSA